MYTSSMTLWCQGGSARKHRLGTLRDMSSYINDLLECRPSNLESPI